MVSFCQLRVLSYHDNIMRRRILTPYSFIYFLRASRSPLVTWLEDPRSGAIGAAALPVQGHPVDGTQPSLLFRNNRHPTVARHPYRLSAVIPRWPSLSPNISAGGDTRLKCIVRRQRVVFDLNREATSAADLQW